jgi:GTP-binding protein EngB required for normal cell division
MEKISSVPENEIPVFAIVGHPNEGKSSVVSTLSEDDQVRISPYPGETVECMSFPVFIDNREIIRFVDTPGFQNPGKTLSWMNDFKGKDSEILQAFIEQNFSNPDFEDEIKLLSPISKGACIIYVADGSRPVRTIDKMEMEILRLTGQPRMVVLNIKENDKKYLDDWKREFIKHFNSVRIFNAHTATYRERITLLESLKAIHQDWQKEIGSVVDAFKNDWDKRAEEAAEYIISFLKQSISFKIKKSLLDKSKSDELKKELVDSYKKELVSLEQATCKKIKKLYKHNIFNYSLPDYSILNEDLFDQKNLEILGLKPGQIAVAGGVAGGMMGAVADGALHGISFGLFTSIGGAAGAGYAWFNKNRVADVKVAGMKIGNLNITVGPCRNIQLFYVLMDRILIYYSHAINWAHGKREQEYSDRNGNFEKIGFSSLLDKEKRKIFDKFFKQTTRPESVKKDIVAEKDAVLAMKSILYSISDDSFLSAAD